MKRTTNTQSYEHIHTIWIESKESYRSSCCYCAFQLHFYKRPFFKLVRPFKCPLGEQSKMFLWAKQAKKTEARNTELCGCPTTDPETTDPRQLIPNNWSPNNWSPKTKCFRTHQSTSEGTLMHLVFGDQLFGDQLLGISCRAANLWV